MLEEAASCARSQQRIDQQQHHLRVLEKKSADGRVLDDTIGLFNLDTKQGRILVCWRCVLLKRMDGYKRENSGEAHTDPKGVQYCGDVYIYTYF